MTDPRVRLERQGPLAIVSMTSAPVNLLDVAMMNALADAARDAAKDARAILLRSEVPAQFSQGVDPAAVLDADLAGRKRVFLALADMVEAWRFAGVPTIADVSGPALAGGAVLATLVDFALIARNAGKICFSEVKVGLPLPRFIQELVRSKTPPPSWNELMLLGKNVDAVEAGRIGLANTVYTSTEERDDALEALVQRIARLAPAAVSATLKAARAPERPLYAEFRASVGEFADYLTDDFLGKGLRAVVRGESPRF